MVCNWTETRCWSLQNNLTNPSNTRNFHVNEGTCSTTLPSDSTQKQRSFHIHISETCGADACQNRSSRTSRVQVCFCFCWRHESNKLLRRFHRTSSRIAWHSMRFHASVRMEKVWHMRPNVQAAVYQILRTFMTLCTKPFCLFAWHRRGKYTKIVVPRKTAAKCTRWRFNFSKFSFQSVNTSQNHSWKRHWRKVQSAKNAQFLGKWHVRVNSR